MKLDLFKISKWVAAWSATASLVFSPVAMGKESQNITMEMMKNAMEQMGLNRSMTFGEFYDLNKNLYPPRIQKELEPVVAQFKNVQMPQFELVASKATDGTIVPTMRTAQEHELISTQWFGDDTQFVKLQNTMLSRIDLYNFDDAVIRVLAGDENLRKGLKPLRESAKILPLDRQFTFPDYPDVSARDWKQMSELDRAAYIVNLRLLWQAAKKVLSVKENSGRKNRKTSQFLLERNRNYIELLLGQPANAAALIEDGKTCIIAGYVSQYVKKNGEVCDHELVDQKYNKDPFYVAAKAVCDSRGKGEMACNPNVFGTPDGNPKCITPNRDRKDPFQKATHFDGLCDKASPLQSDRSKPQELLANDKLKGGRYDLENVRNDVKEKSEKAEDANNFALTEQYLLGVLKFKKVVDQNAKGLFGKEAKGLFADGVLDEKVLLQIQADKKAFDTEIKNATATCKEESDVAKNPKIFHESNYWEACDQMQRRFLHVEKLLMKKCPVKSQFNYTSYKCDCAEPSGQAVMAGAKCGAPVVANPVLPPVESGKKTEKQSANCRSRYGTLEPQLTVDCDCPDSRAPDIEAENGAKKIFTCDRSKAMNNQGIPGRLVKEEPCGFFCNFSKNIGKIGLVIAATVAAYFFLRKTVPIPVRQNPGDGCPAAGVDKPCVTTCGPNLATVNGVCNSCAGCPDGQSNSLANACKCTTKPAEIPLFECPDGTFNSDRKLCPYHDCLTTNPPSKFQDPKNCPKIPVSTSTTTTPPPVNQSR